MEPPTIPPTMRAWTYSTPGTYRQILSLKTLPTPPLPTGSELLFKVAYAGIDHTISKIFRILPSFLIRENSIPGTEFAGTVVARGPDAPSQFSVGAKVIVYLQTESIVWGRGSFCEYFSIDTKKCSLALVPENLSMEEASCISSGGMMAMLIHKLGKIPDGSGYRILVNGASGGCGSAFVQTALGLGAKEVVGICSGSNAEFVQSLGAAQTIDYRTHVPLYQYLEKEYGTRPFDFVFDTIGTQELYTHSPAYLKEDGAYFSIGDYAYGMWWTFWYMFVNLVWPWWLGGTPRKFGFASPSPNQESMTKLMGLVSEGKVKVHIEKVFEFEELREAFDLGITKRVRGKMVLKVCGVD